MVSPNENGTEFSSDQAYEVCVRRERRRVERRTRHASFLPGGNREVRGRLLEGWAHGEGRDKKLSMRQNRWKAEVGDRGKEEGCS